MNYYEHHLGDYMRDAGHLSLIEDGAYRRLLDAYYVREKPLPSDVKECQKLARCTNAAERKAVAYVLSAFFNRHDDGHHQKRCDEVIAEFYAKQQKARDSANARWGAKRTDSGRNANASASAMRTHDERIENASQTHMRTACESDALQSPVPNPHTPEKSKTPPIPPRDRGVSSGRDPKVFEPANIPELDLPSWERWVQYRAERKPALKPASLQAAAQELAKFGAHQAQVVQHSIANGYQGLFAPKVNGNCASAAEPVRYRTADELEDSAIAEAVRKGLSDAQIAALEDLAVAPNLPARIREKREELQREQH